MCPEDAVRTTYEAYNARNLGRAMANLAPDVDWDDGKGNMVHGRDAVADHWSDQWRNADARVEIKDLRWSGSGFSLSVCLDTRKPDGSRSVQLLTNTIQLEGDRIRVMHIG